MNNVICDLCGGSTHKFVLQTARLDGPLWQCLSCGLFFVVLPVAAPALTNPAENLAPPEIAAAEMQRLAGRAQELFLIDHAVEAHEQKWRTLTATERLTDLQQQTKLTHGKLLEIGSSTGEFLAAASSIFDVVGIEADASTCAITRARGFDCRQGTLFDANLAAGSFDVIVLYHVIEHVPSPRQLLSEIARLLRPGGWLVLETPNIATIWFRLLGARWRQFIPDHRYFFTPATMQTLVQANGFDLHSLKPVGKAMSARLFINRFGRYHRPLAQLMNRTSTRLGWQDKTLHLNLGDVLRLSARVR